MTNSPIVKSNPSIVSEDDSPATSLPDMEPSKSDNIMTNSPIVKSNPSIVSEDDSPATSLPDMEPSKSDNVSSKWTILSLDNPLRNRELQPSVSGWPSAQHIIVASPQNGLIPSTSEHLAKQTYEDSSSKDIEECHKKILNELYGDTWKSALKIKELIQQETTLTRKLNDQMDKENDFKRTETNLTNKENSSPRKGNDFTSKGEIFYGESSTSNVVELTSRTENMSLVPNDDLESLSFMASLAEDVPPGRCLHLEALPYRVEFKKLRQQLTRRLYAEFNREVFGDALPADMCILWDAKFTRTAGQTRNEFVVNSKGERTRTCTIELSIKLLDSPQRLRDTLIHEMCHAANWIIDAAPNEMHGSLWKNWTMRALQAFPELGEIPVLFRYEIHYKYTFKCTQCGYSIKRHSKSIDITKKSCGRCFGKFEIFINTKDINGVVTSRPVAKPNEFALYVKENYANVRDGTKTHAEVMKILSERYSAMKNKAANTQK